jgi:hypothetical protein
MLEKKEGKYEEALQHYRTALRIATHFFGKQHPSVGMYLTNLGDIYRYGSPHSSFCLGSSTLSLSCLVQEARRLQEG